MGSVMQAKFHSWSPLMVLAEGLKYFELYKMTCRIKYLCVQFELPLQYIDKIFLPVQNKINQNTTKQRNSRQIQQKKPLPLKINKIKKMGNQISKQQIITNIQKLTNKIEDLQRQNQKNRRQVENQIRNKILSEIYIQQHQKIQDQVLIMKLKNRIKKLENYLQVIRKQDQNRKKEKPRQSNDKDGKNRTNGKDGKDGKNRSNGKDGKDEKNRSNGKDGKNRTPFQTQGYSLNSQNVKSPNVALKKGADFEKNCSKQRYNSSPNGFFNRSSQTVPITEKMLTEGCQEKTSNNKYLRGSIKTGKKFQECCRSTNNTEQKKRSLFKKKLLNSNYYQQQERSDKKKQEESEQKKKSQVELKIVDKYRRKIKLQPINKSLLTTRQQANILQRNDSQATDKQSSVELAYSSQNPEQGPNMNRNNSNNRVKLSKNRSQFNAGVVNKNQYQPAKKAVAQEIHYQNFDQLEYLILPSQTNKGSQNVENQQSKIRLKESILDMDYQEEQRYNLS